jgi:hypothetical protein
MSFKVLHRTKLDEVAYLRCLAFTDSRGEASAFYAQPWYLDIVGNGNWSVAVWQLANEEYELVLPFVHQRKWGVLSEVYMPFLCQQLGVFGRTNEFLVPFVKEVFKYWQSKFWRIGYSFNTDSLFDVFEPIPNSFNSLHRVNQELDCALSREAIWKGISDTKQKHIRRGERTVELENKDAVVAIDWFLKGETGLSLNLKSKQIALLHKLIKAFSIRGMLVAYGVVHKETKEPLLGLLQVRHGNRVISLFGGPTNKAKDNYAQDYALWQSMQLIAGLPNAVLDFEGSNLKGVQQYNAAFGAVIKQYQHVSYKRW